MVIKDYYLLIVYQKYVNIKQGNILYGKIY